MAKRPFHKKNLDGVDHQLSQCVQVILHAVHTVISSIMYVTSWAYSLQEKRLAK